MYILVLLGKKDIFCIFEEIIGELWHLTDYVRSSAPIESFPTDNSAAVIFHKQQGLASKAHCWFFMALWRIS